MIRSDVCHSALLLVKPLRYQPGSLKFLAHFALQVGQEACAPAGSPRQRGAQAARPRGAGWQVRGLGACHRGTQGGLERDGGLGVGNAPRTPSPLQ